MPFLKLEVLELKREARKVSTLAFVAEMMSAAPPGGYSADDVIQATALLEAVELCDKRVDEARWLWLNDVQMTMLQSRINLHRFPFAEPCLRDFIAAIRTPVADADVAEAAPGLTFMAAWHDSPAAAFNPPNPLPQLPFEGDKGAKDDKGDKDAKAVQQ